MDARLKAIMTMTAILIMCGAFVMMSEEACVEEGASSTLDSNATTYASEPSIIGTVKYGTYTASYDTNSSKLTITVRSDSGYYLPDKVYNTYSDYTWEVNSNRTSGTLTFTNVGPDDPVRFTITCDKPEFSVSVDHGSYSTSYSASDDTYTVTIRANSGYVVPESVTVTSYTSSWNPNGSSFAIEGIISPDGQILGKMGHTERFEHNLFKNIPEELEQPLFDNAVRYFRKH